MVNNELKRAIKILEEAYKIDWPAPNNLISLKAKPFMEGWKQKVMERT